jgi:hypothetical protein
MPRRDYSVAPVIRLHELTRLEFTKTFEGLLRVSVSAGDARDRVIAIYEDDRTFLRLVRNAISDSDVVMTLERAVIIAFSPTKTPTHCDGLALTDEQLVLLRLGTARKLCA